MAIWLAYLLQQNNVSIRGRLVGYSTRFSIGVLIESTLCARSIIRADEVVALCVPILSRTQL